MKRLNMNLMVRQFVKRVLGRKRRRLAALERIQHLLDRPPVHLGSHLPNRESLHQR